MAAPLSAIWCLLLISSTLSAAQSHGHLKIPRIIHRNYMAGMAALQAASAGGPQSVFKAHWLASCTAHNPGWQEIVWDEAAVLRLIQDDFPWFLPTYLSYPRLVQRSDAMRYMALYKYGGVYLDADVECYTNMEQSLHGQDLVLSCEEPGAWGQLHNAAMASTAGHPFWLAVLQEAMRRAPAALAESNSWTVNQLRMLWRQTPFHDGLLDVLRTTGPILLTDVYRRHTGGAPACGHTITMGGSASTAYPVGSWFTPCLCSDDDCLRRWNVQHFQLVERQQQGESWTAEEPSRVLQQQMRNHSGRERRHQRRWQQQQHLQAVQVQELAPERVRVVGIHQYSASWTGWDQSHRVLQQQRMQEEMSRHVLDYFANSDAFIQPLPTTSSSPCAPSTAAAPPTPLLAAAASSDDDLARALRGPQHSTCAALAVVEPATARSIDGCSADSPQQAQTNCACVGRCAVADDSTGHNSTSAAAAAERTPLAEPASRLSTQRLQQLGCSVTLVTPGPQTPWPAQEHNSSQAAAAPATACGAHSLGALHSCVQHVQGVVRPAAGHTSSGSEDVSLPALLQQQAADAVEDARHVMYFSCSGCELPVLRELFAVTWAGSSALEHVRVLFIDVSLPSSAASCSNSSSCFAQATGWDEVYNLLHQQMGFRGFWRQQLDSNTLQLGWVRQPVPAHAKLQPADASHAAGVLEAASVRTPRAELKACVCDCCQTCCRSSGAHVPRAGQLWQCAACKLIGTAAAHRPCRFLAPAGTEGAAGSSVGGSDTNCGTSGCGECCACKPRLLDLLQLLWRPHEVVEGTTTPGAWLWLSSTAVPALVTCFAIVATGKVLQLVHRAAHTKRMAGWSLWLYALLGAQRTVLRKQAVATG